VLPSKRLIVVSSECTAKEKAMLLTGGADDVLQLTMNIEEAVMRIHALLRRILWCRNNQQLEQHKSDIVCSSSIEIDELTMHHLTKQERFVLKILLEKEGVLVPYADFLKIRHDKTNVASQTTLRVVIHHIRKKLKSHWNIVNIRGLGFLLTSKKQISACNIEIVRDK
jgi:OmpR family two-component system bacitracin resistance response regulator BceR